MSGELHPSSDALLCVVRGWLLPPQEREQRFKQGRECPTETLLSNAQE